MIDFTAKNRTNEGKLKHFPLTLLSLIFLSVFQAMAQTNPGGVTGANLWLKGDAGTTPASGTLTGWTDQTGTNSFIVHGNPQTGATPINFHNTVDFDEDGDYMSGNTAITWHTAYAVAWQDNGLSTHAIICANDTDRYIMGGSDLRTRGGKSGWDFAFYPTPSRFVFMLNPHLTAVELAPGLPGPYQKGFIDGLSYSSASPDTVNIMTEIPYIARSLIWTTNTIFYFIDSTFFDGRIAEVIMFPGSHTDDERKRIQSYLAIKYGITLDTSMVSYVNSAGTSVWDNTSYWHEVFGIGKDDASGLNQTQSNSATTGSGTGSGQYGKGNIVLGNASSLDDGDFLMIGHNNAGLTPLPILQSDGTYLLRLGREWKVKRTGDPGSVTLAFNTVGLGVSGISASDFILLIDEDGNGDFTNGTVTQVTANSLVNNVVTFNNVQLDDNVVFSIITGTTFGPGVLGASLWLKANEGATNSGSTLTGWTDQTTINAFTVTGTPGYLSNNVNFHPAVDFQNGPTGSGLATQRLDGDKPIKIVEAFGVYKYKELALEGTVLGSSEAGTGSNPGAGIFAGVGPASFASDLNGNGMYYNYSDPYSRFNIDNLDLSPTTPPGTASIDGASSNVQLAGGTDFNELNITPVIGGRNNTSVTSAPYLHMNGQVAEVITYPFSLSNIDRLKVQSYLAVKYGVTLDKSVAKYLSNNGTEIWNDTTYWHDVFGIGKDDASRLNQTQSNSINTGNGNGAGQSGKCNILLGAPTSLDDEDFLMMGHDNGSLIPVRTDMPAGLNMQRLGREWKVKRTGDPGNVALKFDTNGLIKITGTKNADFTVSVFLVPTFIFFFLDTMFR